MSDIDTIYKKLDETKLNIDFPVLHFSLAIWRIITEGLKKCNNICGKIGQSNVNHYNSKVEIKIQYLPNTAARDEKYNSIMNPIIETITTLGAISIQNHYCNKLVPWGGNGIITIYYTLL